MARSLASHGHGVRLAVTGTPGTGKTTLCAEMARAGRRVLSLTDLARDHGAILGEDDGVLEIDTERLAAVPLPADVVVDGHLSHCLDVDAVWVVRCDPRVLRKRLEARGYAPGKVQENVEAEAIDLVLQEALATGRPVVQRDGTRRSPAELFSAFEETRPAALKKEDLEPVDWSDFLLE